MSQISIGILEAKVEHTFGGMYGMQLIASKLNAVIYGAAMIMVLQYFMWHSNGDTHLVKGMVILLVALATLQAVCVSCQVFEYFILKFGRKELFDITVSTLGKYVGIYLTAFVAQIFYATRIWNLTGRLAKHYQLLTYPVVLLSLLQVASGIALIVLMGNMKTTSNLILISSIAFKMIVLQGVSAAACDVAIAASFSFIFQSNRSGINSRTHSLLSKFIIYAINRAAATSICALLTVLLYHYLLGAFCYMIPLLLNTHLYVISVISVLTARGSLQEEDHSFRLTDIVRLPSIECDTDSATPTQRTFS
ncbi:hypothetical protein BDQ17DRAFT_1414158 [Cyathus striatus]|nr:hypothetical protein BDQ17DRAFT_1414158 [Cyathus striatus]